MDWLPHLNAALNGSAGILLFVGWRFVRAKKVSYHRACMIAAFACSVAFLVSYLSRMALSGHQVYPGEGWDRLFYLVLLTTHVSLAATVPPLAIRTLYLALHRRYDTHRRWARVTFPIWIYVSVTGVAVYWMLFQRF